MTTTVTSHNYPDLGVFTGHSVLTGKLITFGRVVQCSKGFLPQVKRHNKWINISKSLPTLEEARDYLFKTHYSEAQKKRGWTDEQLQIAILKVQEKNIKLWADRWQKRIELQAQLNANRDAVKAQAIQILNDPQIYNLSARDLARLVEPLYEKVLFPPIWIEQTKVGVLRALKKLIDYCDNVELQTERINRLSEVI